MPEERSGKERRVNKSRRSGGDSQYTGPEKRGIKDRRSDKDRRDKE